MPFLFTRQQTGIDMISPTQIKTSKFQPRRHFSQNAIDELAQSIKQHGILSPLLVCKTADGYELIAGERRLRAAISLGFLEVPCIVSERTDKECAEIAIIENIQREQLSFFEEAESYLRLQEEFGLTQGDIAKRVCKKQSTVSNKLRLLKLPITARAIITAAGLTERHARELLRIHNKDKLFYAFDKIVEMDNVKVVETDFQDIVSKFMPKSKNTGRSQEVSSKDQSNKFISRTI